MSEDSAESLVKHLYVYRDSERPALQVDSLTLSYKDLIQYVESTAVHLASTGVKAGDRVLVMMPNSAEHIIGVLATLAIGAIAVPLDTEAGSSRQADAMTQTAPRFCLACENVNTAANICTIRLHIDATTRALHYSQEGSASEQEPVVEPRRRIAFIRFTSGSTGHAKGVVITDVGQLWTARTLSDCFGIDAEHRELVLVSMALSGGWQRVAATLYAGGCVVIGAKPLTVGDLLESLVDSSATGFFTPPPLVRMLLAGPASKVSAGLRGCSNIEIGSAALMEQELQDFMARVPHAQVYVHYGLTECSRAVVLDAARHPARLATVGRPLPGVELKIVDQQGNDLPFEQSGQILLRGPQLCSGYWQLPGLNSQRFIDGWLATGDYGVIDQDGFLTLLGRHDDLINCGGYCYFPDEVEQALGAPPGIEQYLVAGVPDPRGVLQQVPWAFVVPTHADDWSPMAFLKLARARLPAHMVPRQVVTVPTLPLTASGKPDRRETVKLHAPRAQIQTDGQNRDR